jgi:Bacterial membrane protein YfhO
MTIKEKISKNKALSAAALIAIPLIYFYPVLLGQVILAPGDGWAQNFPMRVLAGQMIARGQLPLWNPFIFAGMPLAASVYPGAFYPPNFLFAILPATLAMNIVVLVTYYLALIGTYLYSRRIGISRTGALIAGIAFTFGGFMINHLSHTSRIAAAAWLPWVLLAIENLARSQSWRQAWLWSALGAILIALQFLAGEPQMSVFTCLVSVPCAAYAFRYCESRKRFILAMCLMVIGGALLSAIQLLPSLELLAQSERSDPGPAFFGVYSFPPWQLPALIFPYFFGGAFFPPYRVPYWGRDIAAIMSGYVGILTWVLALIAIFGKRRNGRVWLWAGIAVVSIILAFGGYLPFKLNDLLYHVPGYKTFRGLYRHQFEFTFAMAMLAGLGMSYLANLKRQFSRRALMSGTIAMSAITALIVILYLFFGENLAATKPRPEQASSLANAEFTIPIAFFILTLTLLWISNLKSHISNPLLPALLLLDLASYGHFFHWRIATFNVNERLADPPAVQLIKSREKEFNSFRIMSHPVQAYDYASHWPEDPNFELIDQPNISILRGLQSLSGYDILRPVRVGEMTGAAGSAIQGFVQDLHSFGLVDRGLDLLNLKYLIVGYGGATGKREGFTYSGVYFARTNFGIEFKPGVKLTTEPGGIISNEIAIVSTLANSGHLTDGAPVLKIKLYTRDGRVIERELVAGRDTSEWAYDRADVRANAKHRRALIVENTAADGFEAHLYLGRLKFDRAEIDKIEWVYPREDASLFVMRASLHDETTGSSIPLSAFYLPPERWRRLARFDQIELYENLQAMPRAWFVQRVIELSREDVMRAIRTSSTPAGEKFDPSSTAILDKGDVPPDIIKDIFKNYAAGSSQVKITLYEPNRIEMETSREDEGYLVLSEVFYDGWRAYLDGKEQPVIRTNYMLRGIHVPPGDHKIQFVYRPQSLRNGALLSLSGLVLLTLACIVGYDESNSPQRTQTGQKAQSKKG